MKFSVVIPTANDANLSALLGSLVFTHSDAQGIPITVVDDGVCERKNEYGLNLQYVKGESPFCFARNVNLGIAALRSDTDIVLLNDDVYFLSDNVLGGLSQAAEHDPNVGLISPTFANYEKNPRQSIGVLRGQRELWKEEEASIVFPAVYISRRLIDTVGLLDERFTGYGYEDNDYCRRARLAGYHVCIAPYLFMAHARQVGQSEGTFRKDSQFREKFKHNRKVFLGKWLRETLPDATVQQIDQAIELIEQNFSF